MFDWSLVIMPAVVLLGFGGTIAIQVFFIGRYTAKIDGRLSTLDFRMSKVEEHEKQITQVLIQLAETRTELNALTARIDDVYKYGNHRLAEVLDAVRAQIMSDFKERMEYLQRSIKNDSGNLR